MLMKYICPYSYIHIIYAIYIKINIASKSYLIIHGVFQLVFVSEYFKC